MKESILQLKDVIELLLKAELDNSLVTLTNLLTNNFKIYIKENLRLLKEIISKSNDFRLIDNNYYTIKITFFDKDKNKMLLEL